MFFLLTGAFKMGDPLPLTGQVPANLRSEIRVGGF